MKHRLFFRFKMPKKREIFHNSHKKRKVETGFMSGKKKKGAHILRFFSWSTAPVVPSLYICLFEYHSNNVQAY